MKFRKTNADGVWIIEPEIHVDKRGFLYEAYRQDQFFERGLSQKFISEYELELDGEAVLGNRGYLIHAPKGTATVIVAGLSIEIEDKQRHQVYVETGIEVKVSGKGSLIIRSC